MANGDGNVDQRGARNRVQNGSCDRSGLSKTRFGEEPGKQEKNDLS
jgi:hypothetical protein